MPETVTADITAAIALLLDKAFLHRLEVGDGTGTEPAAAEKQRQARVNLEAAILHHLRAYAEMKAALDLQTSGGA